MDQPAVPSPTNGKPASFFEKNYFLIRRLHSLTGVAPVGLFLLFHLTTNASIVWGMLDSRKAEGGGLRERGVNTFGHEVDFIHSTPFLFLIEVFGLWLPILFHSVLGFYYASTGSANTSRYAYQANWRYRLQRISGYIGFLFIFYHVATLRWGWTWMVPGGTAWTGEFAATTMAAILRGSSVDGSGFELGGVVVSLAYLVGVSLMIFHFANGLWTAAITWGITISAKAQEQWGRVCFMIGLGLMALGWSAVIGFATLNPSEVKQMELKRRLGHSAVTPSGPVSGMDIKIKESK